MKIGVEVNQKKFFNRISDKVFTSYENNFFFNYVNKEQIKTLRWLSQSKKILEYGCGTGGSLDIFFKNRNIKDYHIYGVDIAKKAILKAQKKYNKGKFYTIKNNKIPQIKDSSIDAAFMFHVLHHSHFHSEIFKEINAKLVPNGKFLINDLTSNNIFISAARSIFYFLPKSIKLKFNEDLVIDNSIPEKYKVDINDLISMLEKCNFKIIEIGYGHLFFFVFGWIDRFIPFSKLSLFQSLYRQLVIFEQYLLRYSFFQRGAEVIYVKSIKLKS